MQNPANQCKRDNQKRLKGAPESAPKECIQVHFFAKVHLKKKPVKDCFTGFCIHLQFVKVVPAGIEPATQGFSVLCSTN